MKLDDRDEVARLLRRRAFLGSAAAAGLLLPVLRSGRVYGQAGRFPTRFVSMFHPNGMIPENFWPTGSGTDLAGYTFPRVLKPVEPFRAKLVVCKGLSMMAAKQVGGNNHHAGGCAFLTGTGMISKPYGIAGGISLDVLLGQRVGGGTPFASLQLGVNPIALNDAGGWNRHSYLGPGQPIVPEVDPAKVFDRVFGEAALPGGAAGPDPALEAIRQQRQSVLDFTTKEIQSLRTRLAGDERVRLDLHLDSLRALERSLQPGGAVAGASCSRPTITKMAALDEANYPAVGKAVMDIIVAAFACGRTRVASVMWGGCQTWVQYKWLGYSGNAHGTSHETTPAAREKMTVIHTWHAEQVAYLLGKLDAVKEGTGTLLDNSVVMWSNELGRGDNHSYDNVPFVLGGGCGGAIKTGRHLAYDGRSINDLLVSIANAMGVPITTFGRPEACKGPLPGLVD